MPYSSGGLLAPPVTSVVICSQSFPKKGESDMSDLGATYECTKCGMRVVVSKPGADTPPSHCGQPMTQIHDKGPEPSPKSSADPAMRGGSGVEK